MQPADEQPAGFFRRLFGRKTRDVPPLPPSGRRPNHTFSEEERELSEISRLQNTVTRERLQIQKDRLQRLRNRQREAAMEEEIADLEDEIYGNDEDESTQGNTPEDLLQSLFIRKMFGGESGNPRVLDDIENINNSPQQFTVTQTAGKKERLSDEEIDVFISELSPKARKRAKTMNDMQMRVALKLTRPDILERFDDDTLQRAFAKLRK